MHLLNVKRIKTFVLWLKQPFYGVSCLELEGEMVVKLFAHVHRHMPMRIHKDVMLPFVEKVSNGKCQNRPPWQPKIVYPTTLMYRRPSTPSLMGEA